MAEPTALKLIPGNEGRIGSHWSADDYDVVLVDSGECVGRIYARIAPGGGHSWWWGLAFPHTLSACQPYYGLAESKEAAKHAFAERWRT